MEFSVGILYSAQTFLEFINKTTIKATEFSSLFKRFETTSSQLVLEVAGGCNWITVDVEGNIRLSEQGKEILIQDNMRDALRVQLKYLIEEFKPSWSYLIHKGRKEAFQYFPTNVKQCFKEAELINSFDPDVIKWWDILASIARGKQQDTQLEVGRIGEELSLVYERNRIRKNPVWQSVESNLSGFDILSCVSSIDMTPLKIEVKTTTISSELFTFYVTRNEWNVAELSQHYYFHLWILGKEPELFIIDKMDLVDHIPLNQGCGYWENAKVILDIKTLQIINKKE
ncbi:protein NO VEIN domain-containing protein [Bacillus albus]|uniref:DUF3883 domain-containing protein n=1 Tax=Bacillus albus TaxID=2026189 RepID=UPI0018A14F8A|nr:DUF3883 domain-containing protein [Bacillus albus]MBF7155073.1 DUF3883 domain-containing protein [Bacillus albus]